MVQPNQGVKGEKANKKKSAERLGEGCNYTSKTLPRWRAPSSLFPPASVAAVPKLPNAPAGPSSPVPWNQPTNPTPPIPSGSVSSVYYVYFKGRLNSHAPHLDPKTYAKK